MGYQIIGRFLSLSHRFQFWIFYHVSEYVAEAIYPGKNAELTQSMVKSNTARIKKHPW